MKRYLTCGLIGHLAVMTGIVAFAGCGGSDDDDASADNGNGTVTEEWQEYCTGTFTADTMIEDGFGDPLFTAHAGEEYLLADYGDFIGETRAEFVYLTAAGPETFDVAADESGDVPFTSNCMPNAGISYYAVFKDVSVYADVGLMTKICDLSAGTVLPATASQLGYGVAGDELSLTGPATYEVSLNAFSTQCRGNDSGFISVPETVLHGTHTWLVPIIGIIGPPSTDSTP